MKKFVLIVPVLAGVLLTGCDMQRALQANQDAIDQSTWTILENADAVDRSTQAIQENKRQLDAINQALSNTKP